MLTMMETRYISIGAWLVLVLASLGLCQQRADVTFTQQEEQTSGSFVGSVSNSPPILQMVGEEDRTSLQYSILSQGFENSKYFVINRNSGNITFNGTIDREVVCQFSDTCDIFFDVAVRGNNNFFSTILVKIVIIDRNDNSPRFPEASMTVHISESANPSDFSLPLITASDADRSPDFGVRSYSINPESSVFDVEFSRNLLGTPQVSLTLKQKLDRETEDDYSITIIAEDGGTPPRKGYLRVDVVVDDYNDNEPVFSETFYRANFSENAGQGHEIIQVMASDDDKGENGVVSFSLSSIPDANAGLLNKIAVNSSTGYVTLVESLTSGEYDILIDAHDHGTPRKSSQAVVRVTVLDTDNNKPDVTVNALQLGDLPPGFVSEESDPGTVVAVLNIDDPDSGRNGNVTCESSSVYFQLQQLQKNSFKLMVAQRLNREMNSTHTVSVTCRDQGTPSLNETVSIRINVADENDNSPVFSRPAYQQKIVENNLVGDTVIIVNAVDQDAGSNAEIEYRLKNEGGNFTITPDTGIIRANIKLNREEKSTYNFNALAVDKGSPRKTSEASIVVLVIDMNDVKPIFSKDSYTFSFYENRDPDSVVGNISVSDPDENEGGIVSLSLSPFTEGDHVPFKIDAQGRLSSRENFDREMKDTYDFYVLARDNGQRRLSSSVQVTVNVLDLNDNSPNFVFPSEQNFTTLVNVPIENDDVILKVEVTDKDEKKNQIITYTLSTSSNATDLFRIGKFSGEIIAKRRFGLADMGVYFITVNATDQGYPMMWDSRTLRLVVQSESASKDDVMADQNVLIVACIVCFTIIVSGGVLVAMYVLRRLDRQKKLQYAAACCPDNRQESDNGNLPDQHQQYDLSISKPKEASSRQEKDSTYFQQAPHPQGGSSHGSTSEETNSSHIFMDSTDSRGTNSSYQGALPFYLIGPGAKVPESSLQRQEDFHSTSSAETVTGDSGHGSDEDLSNSMDHSSAPSTLLDQPITSTSGSMRAIPSTGYRHPDLPPKQLHTIQKPSVSKSTTPRSKMNSVRFDPHVTDIYERACPSITSNIPQPRPSYNDNVQINPALRASQQSSHNFFPLPHQQHQQQQQQQMNDRQRQKESFTSPKRFGAKDKVHPRFSDFCHQQEHQHSEPKQLLITKGHVKPHPSDPLPPRHLLSLSHASSLNDDDSDLNTTTSGSYSVASDDVGRISSLLDANDLYV